MKKDLKKLKDCKPNTNQNMIKSNFLIEMLQNKLLSSKYLEMCIRNSRKLSLYLQLIKLLEQIVLRKKKIGIK